MTKRAEITGSVVNCGALISAVRAESLKAAEFARYWVSEAGEGNHGWDGVALTLQGAADALDRSVEPLTAAEKACNSALGALIQIIGKGSRPEVLELLSVASIELQAALGGLAAAGATAQGALRACTTAGGVQQLEKVVHELIDEQINDTYDQVEEARGATIIEHEALISWGRPEGHDVRTAGNDTEPPELARRLNPPDCTGLPRIEDLHDPRRFAEPHRIQPIHISAYARIIEHGSDVALIAHHTKFSIETIAIVKKHLFLTQHEIPVAAETVVRGYFTPDPQISDLWEKALRDTLSRRERDEFGWLITHEYVESQLMRRGIPYRSHHFICYLEDAESNNPTRDHYGAHDLAPNSNLADAFAHWTKIWEHPGPEPALVRDPNRLDELVDIMTTLEQEMKNERH